MGKEKKTIAEPNHLVELGFEEDQWCFHKGEYFLMKTTFNIQYQVWYKKEKKGSVSRTLEDIGKSYKECKGEELFKPTPTESLLEKAREEAEIWFKENIKGDNWTSLEWMAFMQGAEVASNFIINQLKQK